MTFFKANHDTSIQLISYWLKVDTQAILEAFFPPNYDCHNTQLNCLPQKVEVNNLPLIARTEKKRPIYNYELTALTALLSWCSDSFFHFFVAELLYLNDCQL